VRLVAELSYRTLMPGDLSVLSVRCVIALEQRIGPMPLRGLLQTELDRIRDDVILMGDRVEQAITRSIEALVEQDSELALQVMAEDEAINELRFSIEDSCFTVLATQQPAAIDLRIVVAALNIITDLERIGDYAKGIGQIIVRTEGTELVAVSQRTPRMANHVRDMLHDALDAFVEADIEAAERVCELDDQADHMYREIFESVLQGMIAREVGIRQGMHLLFAAHNLERIGDRVTNIAERVIFMVTGVMEERNR
jgi:phosphate transport system protein